MKINKKEFKFSWGISSGDSVDLHHNKVTNIKLLESKIKYELW